MVTSGSTEGERIYFIRMDENSTMKPAERVLRWGAGR
jgi:hypothetical protein